MDNNKIQEFCKLGNILDKMSEEELKTPQAQIIQQQFFALQEEFNNWMKIVNDPEKLAEHQKEMEIDQALGILASGLNAYLSSPLPKPVEPGVYQEAFNVLVEKVNAKNPESQKTKQEGESQEVPEKKKD